MRGFVICGASQRVCCTSVSYGLINRPPFVGFSISQAVSVWAYEKLLNVTGMDFILAIFNRQVKIVREEGSQFKRQK